MAIPRGQTPERRAYMKAYVESHPRDRRAYKAAYDAAHKAEQAAYREARKEELTAQKAAWYRANREAVLARMKAYAAAHPEQVSAYHKAHYSANTTRIKENVSAYRKKHPDKKTELENRRRVRKLGNGGSHTLAEWQAKCAEFGYACAYCRERKPLTRDHVVPLSKGGSDDISNIVPACQSCNSRKGSRLLTREVI